MSTHPRDAGISVALSGGGHRAALFCLGALLYIVDAKRNEAVGSIASVSGGSLTNGVIAQGQQFERTNAQAFRELVAPFATRLCSKGTLQGWAFSNRWKYGVLVVTAAMFAIFAIPAGSRWVRYGWFMGAVAICSLLLLPLLGTARARVYGWFLAVSFVAAAVTWWVVPLSYDGGVGWWERTVRAAASAPGRFGLFMVSIALWAWLVAGQRGRICASAYRETLFSPANRTTLLTGIHARDGNEEGVDHVFCSTDVQAGEHVYFGRGFIYSYRLGKGDPNKLPLHEVVQASANLPFAFPLKRMATSGHDFAYINPTKCPDPEDRPDPVPPKHMVLTDGGVYDNMADQWAQGFEGRASSCWPEIANEHHEPKELVVVNASAGLEWERMRRLWIPLVGEFLGILKIVDVLYDQTTAHRRWGLVGRFDRADLAGGGMRGAIVHIGSSPFASPRFFTHPEQARWESHGRPKRAQDVIDLLESSGENEETWRQTTRHNAAVATVLCRMGARDTASLLRHGYLLAMANLHVILKYPLPTSLPPIDHFEALARSDQAGYTAWRFMEAVPGGGGP
jgi:hypothetical protein